MNDSGVLHCEWTSSEKLMLATLTFTLKRSDIVREAKALNQRMTTLSNAHVSPKDIFS